MIQEASRIQKVGTTGVYSQQFDTMTENLDQVESLITSTSVRSQDIDVLSDIADSLADKVKLSSKLLADVDNQLENVRSRVTLSDTTHKGLKTRTNILHQGAAMLSEKAMRLQEADVQGALNVTQQMAEQSRQAERMANETTNVLADAERYRKNTENLLAKNSAIVNDMQVRSRQSLEKLEEKIKNFDEDMPSLNLRMCGDNVTDCSNVCGGAGCGSCGGISCDAGAITMVAQALDVAKQQAAKIKAGKDASEQLLRNVSSELSHFTLVYEEFFFLLSHKGNF